jgi:MoaA/NifB/PqqE/SkfB family radical SAM enzyme
VRAVDHIDEVCAKRGVRTRYSLTTNGSLLDERVLDFLDGHGFTLALSFDGLAQDLQRKKGTFELLKSTVPRILARPGISLETNSVFNSANVAYLADSVEMLIRLGVPRLDVNLAHTPPWTAAAIFRLRSEIRKLGRIFLTRYRTLAEIPWPGIYEEQERGVRYCPAGRGRLALSAHGTLWGCPLFPQYFGKKTPAEDFSRFCFGDVRSFKKDARRIYSQKMANYADLRMDLFSAPGGPCRTCPDIEQCWVCPIAAAAASGTIGKISRWNCLGTRLLRKERRLFRDRFESLGREPRLQERPC